MAAVMIKLEGRGSFPIRETGKLSLLLMSLVAYVTCSYTHSIVEYSQLNMDYCLAETTPHCQIRCKILRESCIETMAEYLKDESVAREVAVLRLTLNLCG